MQLLTEQSVVPDLLFLHVGSALELLRNLGVLLRVLIVLLLFFQLSLPTVLEMQGILLVIQ